MTFEQEKNKKTTPTKTTSNSRVIVSLCVINVAICKSVLRMSSAQKTQKGVQQENCMPRLTKFHSPSKAWMRSVGSSSTAPATLCPGAGKSPNLERRCCNRRGAGASSVLCAEVAKLDFAAPATAKNESVPELAAIVAVTVPTATAAASTAAEATA
jgi:hypothetical protein